jgi:hypothetical protein
MKIRNAISSLLVTAAAALGGTLGGEIRDQATGQALAGAKVFIDEVKTRNPSPVKDSAVTGADGRFLFTGLPAITEMGFGFVLRVKLSGYTFVLPNLIQLAASEDKRLDVAARKQVELAVRVGDAAAPEGPPLMANATLEFNDGKSPIFALADSAGYILFRGLTAGQQGMTLAAPGYQTRYLASSVSGTVFAETLQVKMEK